jgi:hypothetical protein
MYEICFILRRRAMPEHSYVVERSIVVITKLVVYQKKSHAFVTRKKSMPKID